MIPIGILDEGIEIKLPIIKYILNNSAISDNTKEAVSAKDFFASGLSFISSPSLFFYISF
jgi:hypothetical protein